jgi:hypothetical protein
MKLAGSRTAAAISFIKSKELRGTLKGVPPWLFFRIAHRCARKQQKTAISLLKLTVPGSPFCVNPPSPWDNQCI